MCVYPFKGAEPGGSGSLPSKPLSLASGSAASFASLADVPVAGGERNFFLPIYPVAKGKKGELCLPGHFDLYCVSLFKSPAASRCWFSASRATITRPEASSVFPSPSRYACRGRGEDFPAFNLPVARRDKKRPLCPARRSQNTRKEALPTQTLPSRRQRERKNAFHPPQLPPVFPF